jgi:hypothetical protein
MPVRLEILGMPKRRKPSRARDAQFLESCLQLTEEGDDGVPPRIVSATVPAIRRGLLARTTTSLPEAIGDRR